MLTSTATKPPKLLLLSPSYLHTTTLLTVSQQILTHNTTTNQPSQIIARTLDNNVEEDLKLGLIICGNYGNGNVGVEVDVGEVWVVCGIGEWRDGVVGIDGRGGGRGGFMGYFVVLEEGQEEVGGCVDGYVFGVRGLRQCLNIMSMSRRQLQKRWKMQQYLQTSTKNHNLQKSHQKLQTLSQTLLNLHKKTQLKIFQKYLTFYSTQRLQTLRKYFTQWLITHYSSQIHRNEEEIIEGRYLVGMSQRKILGRVFGGWKEVWMGVGRDREKLRDRLRLRGGQKEG